MRRLWPLSLVWGLLAWAPLAETQTMAASAPIAHSLAASATTSSPAPLPPLPYAGAPGALPMNVVLQYLGNRLGTQGHFDYRSLLIMQESLPPAFDKANLTVIREAINDPVKRGVRLRFALTRDGDAWTIRTLDEDFSCRNRPVWGTRPCP
jgi:hypothetical protein